MKQGVIQSLRLDEGGVWKIMSSQMSVLQMPWSYMAQGGCEKRNSPWVTSICTVQTKLHATHLYITCSQAVRSPHAFVVEGKVVHPCARHGLA